MHVGVAWWVSEWVHTGVREQWDKMSGWMDVAGRQVVLVLVIQRHIRITFWGRERSGVAAAAAAVCGDLRKMLSGCHR